MLEVVCVRWHTEKEKVVVFAFLKCFCSTVKVVQKKMQEIKVQICVDCGGCKCGADFYRGTWWVFELFSSLRGFLWSVVVLIDFVEIFAN